MTKTNSPRRSVASVKILCDLGQRLGSSLSSLLTGSSIAPAQLQDQHLEISSDQELQVIYNLVRLHSNVMGLGLLAGQQYHITAYGIWGYALITCPSFRNAVELGLRYLDLTFAFAKITFAETEQFASINMQADHLPPAVRRFVIERDSAALQILQQELFGVAMPVRALEFEFPSHGDVSRYQALFNCVPKFGAGANRVSFDREILDMPLPKANAASTELVERQLQTLLSRRSERGGVSAWIRNKLLANLADAPNLDTIAKENFMTERTLRRRLAEEGTTFRDLLAEVRQTMAEELLGSTGLTVSEVSARLGYASTSAFIHAFQKWHQCSPRQFLDARSKEKQNQQAG